MFDSTEIDEILTLRVLTLTDEEKAAGPGHRSAGRRDHRPLRRDVPGGAAAAARRPARSASGRRRRPATTGGPPRPPTPVSPETDAVRRRRASRSRRGSLVRLQPAPAGRRPGHLPRRPGGPGQRRARRPRRRDPRRRHPRRRPGRRPARLVRPLPLLRPRRARTAASAATHRERRPRHEDDRNAHHGALLAVALAGAVVLGVRSMPDIKRYLAIRRMCRPTA